MATQPDRFDALVKDLMEKDGGLWSDNVAKLLRKQHRGIVRMVKAYKLEMEDVAKGTCGHTESHYQGRATAAGDILSTLNERAK